MNFKMFNGEIGRHEFQGTGIREYLDSKTSASWTCSIESAAASPRMEVFVQPWNTKVKPKDNAFHSVSDIIHLLKIPFKFKNIIPDCIISPYTVYIYYIYHIYLIHFFRCTSTTKAPPPPKPPRTRLQKTALDR